MIPISVHFSIAHMEPTAVDAKPNAGNYMERYEFVCPFVIAYCVACEYWVGDLWKSVMDGYSF